MMARLVVLGVAAMYGTNFGSVKLLQDSMSPALAAGLRFAIAGAALAPVLGSVRKEVIVPSIEIGLLVAAGYFAQGLGLQTADASTAAFLCSLAVVVCPLLDVLEGKKLSACSWASAGLAVAGAGVLELGGASAPCAGDLWALLQPVMFGTAFWKTEQAMKKFPDQALPLTAIQILTVAAAAASWALVDAGGSIDLEMVKGLVSDGHVMAALLWTGLGTTALTVVLETWALGQLSSAETTVLFSTEPLWGTAFAHALLGEHVGLNAYAGGALILAACASSFLGSSSAPPAADVPQQQPQKAKKSKGGEEMSRQERVASVGRGLRMAMAGSASWVAMKLEPVQAFISDLVDLV